jgi:hypothetical protein
VPDMVFVFVACFLLRGPSSWGFFCSTMPECEYYMWLMVLCVSMLHRIAGSRVLSKDYIILIKYSWMSVPAKSTLIFVLSSSAPPDAF